MEKRGGSERRWKRLVVKRLPSLALNGWVLITISPGWLCRNTSGSPPPAPYFPWLGLLLSPPAHAPRVRTTIRILALDICLPCLHRVPEGLVVQSPPAAVARNSLEQRHQSLSPWYPGPRASGKHSFGCLGVTDQDPKIQWRLELSVL